MTALLAATTAMARRDWLLLRSYPLRIPAQLLSLLFSLTLFYYVSRLVNFASFDGPDGYFAFIVVGLVILQLVNSTLATAPATLRQELVGGTFERVLVSPAGPVVVLLGSLVFPALYALVLGLLMLGVSDLLFGMDVRWVTAPLSIPLGLLAAFAFAPFAVALLAAVVVVKQAAQGATWIAALVSLVSGLYFPTELLPAGIEWASAVQPFTPAAELLRNVLAGTTLPAPAWQGIGRLVAFAALLMPIAVVILRRALAFAARRGTILEY